MEAEARRARREQPSHRAPVPGTSRSRRDDINEVPVLWLEQLVEERRSELLAEALRRWTQNGR